MASGMTQMLDCEDIQWFIDLIGTDVVLRKIISILNPNIRNFQIVSDMKDFLKENGYPVSRVTRGMVDRLYDKYKVRGIVYSGAH